MSGDEAGWWCHGGVWDVLQEATVLSQAKSSVKIGARRNGFGNTSDKCKSTKLLTFEVQISNVVKFG